MNTATTKEPQPLTELQRHVLDYLHVFLKEPIGTLTIIHHKGREDFEVNYYGSLPAGYYDLYTAPQSSQPERAMVTPWITKDKLDRAFPVDQFAAKAQQPAPAWHDAPEREAFDALIKDAEHIHVPSAEKAWQAACAWRREKDAKACDEYAIDRRALYKGRPPYTGQEPGRYDPYTEGASDAADLLSDKIRSGE